MPVGPASPIGQPIAGAWLRIAARVLDSIVLGIISAVVLAPIVLNGDDSAGFGGLGADASYGKVYALALLGAAIGFVWDAVFTKMIGGTPMKRALGMRVVRADDGGPVEWSHAIIRWAVPGALALVPIPLLPGLLNLVIVIVSLVFIFTKPLRQAVWDQVAKTLVVKDR